MAPVLIPQVRSGPWTIAQVDSFLRQAAIPLRLASNGSSFPLVQSVWFLFDGAALWCCTRDDSVLARRLRADPRCGFEVSSDLPPYRGVRGTGMARIEPEAAATVLPRLIERYLERAESPLADWLLSRIQDEVAIRIDDMHVTSWDYTARMTA
jgi:nitroimidazol reductase NimA-like FMN-containing flavoprotein (pyridoxamine 5'-phosphate oxidase superfamily)